MVRGRVHMHFHGEDEAAASLRAAGFAEATLHTPTPDGRKEQLVHIIDARTRTP